MRLLLDTHVLLLSIAASQAAETGFLEVPVTSAHAARVESLPDLHKDPFDRLLIAQAAAEAALLVTNDAPLGRYGPQVRVL